MGDIAAIVRILSLKCKKLTFRFVDTLILQPFEMCDFLNVGVSCKIPDYENSLILNQRVAAGRFFTPHVIC